MTRTLQRLHGVFLGSHAVAAGMVTRAQLQSGLYRRLLRNVYADPGRVPDHRLHVLAAMLLVPADAVVAGRSAAIRYGAPFATAKESVLVTVPPDSSWRGPRGLKVHRTEVVDRDVRTVEESEGLVRLTTPLRTAWEVGTLEPLPSAVAYLDAMVRTGHVTEQDLVQMAAEATGRWGARRFRSAVAMVDRRSQSRPESLVRVACARAGLPAPVPQFVVVEGRDFLGKVDLAWPEERLIVEYEGDHHFDGTQIVRDDARYAALLAAGWRVIRLSSADLHRLEEVVQRIKRALEIPHAAFGTES